LFLSENNHNITPADTLDRLDIGDDIQLRFRYQHAYGVILLVGSITNKKPYLAIWCEHHDDFLAEKDNGQFDSFQVKTRAVGRSPWKLNDESFVKAINKFAQQDKLFSGKIDHFHFVTNHAFFNTTSESQIDKSPICLKQAVESVDNIGNLAEPFQLAIQSLTGGHTFSSQDIFYIIQRLRLVLGPGLSDFEDVVAHTHLPKIHSCESLSADQLDSIRDELINKVYSASSVYVQDSAKHWCCIAGEDSLNPILRAKRITIEEASLIINEKHGPSFKFAPIDRTINPDANPDLTLFEKKTMKGGLVSYLPTLRYRTLSTERHFLEMAIKEPTRTKEILNQLHGVIKGECDDARLEAAEKKQMYGEDMLRILNKRFRDRIAQNPESVYNQSLECLIGMAGILTKECEVWWSPEFDLEGAV
jgi:hypothetical protein